MTTLNRPYITCHMMSTIEGKIASGIAGVNLLDDNYFDLYTEIEHKIKPQAWMCGRVTSEMFVKEVGTPLPKTDIEINNEDFIVPHDGAQYFVTVDTKGLLRWEDDKLTLSDQPAPNYIITVVTHKTPKEYLAHLQQNNISYIYAGENTVNFDQVFHKLFGKFNIQTLLLEGGGLLNGSIMEAGLIDEISLLVCPIVANRKDAPSTFERKAEMVDVKEYKLTEVKQMAKDTVWLRYKKID
ncbi:MAG: dihydrofolate reductase family protein [Weeksellaceae bacterium]